MNSNTALERRLRRQAKRLGYIMRKSRKRNYDYNDQGQYAIINPDYNCIIFGDKFSASLEDIAEVLAEFDVAQVR